MKAITFARGEYRLTELDPPSPGPGEVAVAVSYAAIQWGDVLVRNGTFELPSPSVPGFEASGHVVAVGDDVDEARVGQPVVSLVAAGAFAEVMVAPATLTFAIGALPLRTAAGFGWSTPTAYDLVNTVARVRPGESVLVHAAAGGVGTLAGLLARLAGAGRVVGVAGSAASAAYALDFGYDDVVLRDEFPRALADERFDVVLDPIGGETRRANLDRLAPHGRLAVYGSIDSFEPVTVSSNDLLMTGASLLTYNSNLLSRTHPDRLADTARQALALLGAGTVRVDITADYDLADVGIGVQRLADGGSRGKGIVRVA
jgi:NADPH2:quinone reductase